MKKVFCFLLLLITMSIPASFGFAHSGKTDSDGGHYNHNAGTYHYHHGYPAHYHYNDICPYEDKETTTQKHTTTITTTQKQSQNTLKTDSQFLLFSKINNIQSITISDALLLILCILCCFTFFRIYLIDNINGVWYIKDNKDYFLTFSKIVTIIEGVVFSITTICYALSVPLSNSFKYIGRDLLIFFVPIISLFIFPFAIFNCFCLVVFIGILIQTFISPIVELIGGKRK